MKLLASRASKIGGGVLLAVLGAVAVCELLAWPFLAQPTQDFLTRKLGRDVRFEVEAQQAGQAGVRAFGVRFLGGVQLQIGQLKIASPEWAKAPQLLQASGVEVDLRYLDLWRFYRGEPSLRIDRLRAKQLDAQLERLADGRASWEFGRQNLTPAVPAAPLPRFGRFEISQGQVTLSDRLVGADVTATLSLLQGQTPRLQVLAKGQYRKLPVTVELLASGELPLLVGEDVTPIVAVSPASAGATTSKPVTAPLTPPVTSSLASAAPLGVQLKASVGRARLSFDGATTDGLDLERLSGRFQLSGPSLAAVGDPLGVTLPTTAVFSSKGRLTHQGARWQVQVEEATIGRSQLNGDFVFDASRPVPLLTGRLGGARLELVDLGPAFGAGAEPANTAKSGKVLPSRPFDLAALRAMDADVHVDIAELNLNTRLLEPLRPLRGHLTLDGGVLKLADLEARTPDGSLRGELGLDGRQAPALWYADVRWADVRLERWIHQTPLEGQTAAPPWIAGRLNGKAVLKGEGVSTAEILASMSGTARSELQGGALSHLAVEAAGLDVAQALGVWLKGDDALPVNCAVADLAVTAGVVRPRVLVLDTGDSALWVSGTLSLASEQMDLRAVLAPKDFSPLTLRTPLHVGGSFSAPAVGLEKGPLARKLGGATLLALINPFAALIPLIDTGNTEAAQKAAAGCQRLMQATVGPQAKSKPASASARSGKPPPNIVKPTPSTTKETP